jgi:predicted DNA-binding transcriptional regulator AlpA
MSVSNGQLRIALRVEEAAASLGMSRDSFDRYVLPDVRVIRRGRLILVPISELHRWCERAAAMTLEHQR